MAIIKIVLAITVAGTVSDFHRLPWKCKNIFTSS